MLETAFEVYGKHIEAPRRRYGKVFFGKRIKKISNHRADCAPFLAIYGGGSGFHVTRSAGLHFDEAQNLPVPADQINFPMMPRSAKVARDDDVSASPQIEISFFLAATAGHLMSGKVFEAGPWSDSVKQAEYGLGNAACKHVIHECCGLKGSRIMPKQNRTLFGACL